MKLAAALYRDPELAKRRQWKNQGGPDFSLSEPVGGEIGTEVLAVLNQSGLRRLTGSVRPGRSYVSQLERDFHRSYT